MYQKIINNLKIEEKMKNEIVTSDSSEYKLYSMYKSSSSVLRDSVMLYISNGDCLGTFPSRESALYGIALYELLKYDNSYKNCDNIKIGRYNKNDCKRIEYVHDERYDVLLDGATSSSRNIESAISKLSNLMINGYKPVVIISDNPVSTFDSELLVERSDSSTEYWDCYFLRKLIKK